MHLDLTLLQTFSLQTEQPVRPPGPWESLPCPSLGRAGCTPLGDVVKTAGAAGAWLPEDTLGWWREDRNPHPPHPPHSLQEAKSGRMDLHRSQRPAHCASSAALLDQPSQHHHVPSPGPPAHRLQPVCPWTKEIDLFLIGCLLPVLSLSPFRCFMERELKSVPWKQAEGQMLGFRNHSSTRNSYGQLPRSFPSSCRSRACPSKGLQGSSHSFTSLTHSCLLQLVQEAFVSTDPKSGPRGC